LYTTTTKQGRSNKYVIAIQADSQAFILQLDEQEEGEHLY
jgi:hypothetical protein